MAIWHTIYLIPWTSSSNDQQKNKLGRVNTLVIPATCTKNNMTFKTMFNIFGKCYVLQDIRLEDLLRLRGKHCLSVFGQQTNILPVVCTVSHIMFHNALRQTCRLLTPPTVTLIIPSCMQPIPSHEYVMPKNESYSHSRRPAANKYNLSITHWPVKNYRKPTEAGRRLGLAIRRSGNYYTLSLKK